MIHKLLSILVIASLLSMIILPCGTVDARMTTPNSRPASSDARVQPAKTNSSKTARPVSPKTEIPKRQRLTSRDNQQPAEPKADAETHPQTRGALGNDNCNEAVRVNVPSVTAGATSGALPDPAAGPACGTAITAGGVWYSVLGTGDTITATTCGQDPVQPGSADFDSKISVFCGTCDSLTCVDGNNNGCGFFFQSTVRWCAAQGTEYYIFVHGADAQGTFNLSVYDDATPCNNPTDCAAVAVGACCFVDGTCIDTGETICADAGGEFQGVGSTCSGLKCSGLTPINDDCTGAVFMPLPSTVEGSTVFATRDNAQSCSVFIEGPGVWYTVAGSGNTMTASTCPDDPTQPGASDFDTKITVYCGSCNASSCCAPGNATGCDEPTCQSAVCSVDPFCCDIEWDSFCVAEASYMCGDLCQPVFCVADNDDRCGANPLASTVRWCSQPGQIYYILVHGFAAQTGHFTLSVYDDGEACDNAISCQPCEIECTPGAAVEVEPNCGMPTDIVNGGCNSPIGPVTDCCAAHSGGGCSDPICTDAVCTIDPFCCEETWDLVCADLARANCADCVSIEYRMLPIVCGQTYCSTVGASGDMRDVDWYKLVLEEAGLVEVTAISSFSAVFGIIDNFGIDSCDGLSDFVASAISWPCAPTTVFAELPAGTWYLLIAPVTFSPIECQSEYEFTVSCGSLGACCYDDGSCRQDRAGECAADGGTFLGAGAACTTPGGRELVRTSAPNLDIPDGFPNGAFDEIVVDESILVHKVAVGVEIGHTWVADLEVRLTHVESQRTAILWRGACTGAFDLDITFDDDGDVVTCGAPTTGVVAPLSVNGSPMGTFQGIDGLGRWRLYVTDLIVPENGNLGSWTLHIKPGIAAGCDEPLGRCCLGCEADCYQVDGVIDVFDLFDLLSGWGTAGLCDIAPAGGDGVIDDKDLVALLSAWGVCTPLCQQTTLAECASLHGQWTQGGDCSSDPCTH